MCVLYFKSIARIIFVASFCCALFYGTGVRAEIKRLTVDARPTPTVGVDSKNPIFAWILETPGFFDAKQISYRITVAPSIDALQNPQQIVWDSGIVESPVSHGVQYQGAKLEPSRRYYWQVTAVWRGMSARGESVEKEEVGTGEFVTGLTEGWENADWITADRDDSKPLPILFRDFELQKKNVDVEDAFLHICGLGQQLVFLNSRPLGNRTSIDPGWTNYRKTCLYVTFDVKKELLEREGTRRLAVMLGNGMYNVPGGRYVKFTGSFGLPKVIAQLVVRYKDGSTQTVSTDESWLSLSSPVTFSCVYGGDDVDFAKGVITRDRVLAPNEPQPVVKTTSPGGKLRAQIQPPVVVIETLKPIEVKTLENGVVEANFGYNFAGRPVFRCAPPAESGKVTVSLAEMEGKPWNGHYDSYAFNKDSVLNLNDAVEIMKSPEIATSNENLAPTPLERIGSVFGYWGFQYVYFDGAVYQPDAEKQDKTPADKARIVEIEAERIGADLERVGSFESDGKYLNDIDLMIDRSVRSNIVSLMTDCPHREKLGWLEETHLMGPSILYRYDLHSLFRKICRDISEAQLDDGMVPDIAPEYTRFVQGFFWSAEWSAATVQLPYLLYKWYGDVEIIAQQYETMDRYVRYMAQIRDANGLVKAGLGDWYDWSPEKRHAGYSQHTPGELTATAFLCDNARIMAFFAEFLGKKEDAEFYRNLRDESIRNFQKAYYNPETGVVSTGSQAAYAFALYFGLVPEAGRAKALQNMIDNIESWNYRPSCGEVAWPFVIKTLSEFGRNDVLWKMLQREDAPGYVHMLTKWGMKTLSETWDGPGSSMNHFMFGAIQEWFSSDIVGIKQLDDSVAFNKPLLRPNPILNEISSAKGDYLSPYGKIVSEWRVSSAKEFIWNVTVPTGVVATLEVPVIDEAAQISVQRLIGDQEFADVEVESSFKKSIGDNFSKKTINLGSGRYVIQSLLER